MSAEDLGRRLLGDCVEVGLDRILKSLRTLVDHVDSSQFNLTRLDNFFEPRDVSANDTPTRKALPKSPIIELCSKESGAGKTHLLYLITTLAVLPQYHGDTEVGGKNSSIIIIDTTGHFFVSRLSEIMASYIRTKDSDLPNSEDLISRSLKHVHIFRPQSLAATISTLSSLQDYIFTHCSAARQLHSIVLDDLSTFYWQNRADAESTQLEITLSEQNQNAPFIKPAPPNPWASLVQSLRKLNQTFDCAILATTHAFAYSARDMAGETGLRTLPAPWASFPTVRLLLVREVVRKFALGMSVEEALKEQASRQSVVERARFSATVIGGNEGFVFSIQKDGITIEED